MLTIAIPSYQRRGHLDRLLGSIETAITALGERDTDIEVLVVLDGSTDGSTELIEQHAAQVSGAPSGRVAGEPRSGRRGTAARTKPPAP